jgi:uncharacterized protein YndB with AHSA1/START domain
MYTAACVAAMGLADPVAAGLVEHREDFEGVGEVVAWLRDLQGAWAAELDRVRNVVERTDAARVYPQIYDAPPALVWDYLTTPRLRLQWQYQVTGIETVAGPTGRRGIGVVNHCMHGKDAIIEEVLDWEPYDHVTLRSQFPIPDVPKLVNSFVLEELPDGRTAVEMRVRKLRSAKDRAILEGLAPMLDTSIELGMAALKPLVEAEAKARLDADAAAPEPDLPAGQARNLREPIGAGSR